MSVARSRWFRAHWLSVVGLVGGLAVAGCNQAGESAPEDLDETEQELGLTADTPGSPGDESWGEETARDAIDTSDSRVGPDLIDLDMSPIPIVPGLPLSEPDPLPWRQPSEDTRDGSDSNGGRSPFCPAPA